MNITQILLGSTAAMLLGALILSYGTMRSGEKEGLLKHSATELMQENARIEAEILRYRTGQSIAAPAREIEIPEKMSQTKFKEIKIQNSLLREELATAVKKKEQAEVETLLMNERQSGKHHKEERRAKNIANAMLMAQIKEIAREGDVKNGNIQLIVIDVKMPQSVRIATELAVRRGTGIIGRLTVSSISAEGDVFADPLTGTFPGGTIDLKVGDELIIPPY